MRIWPLRLIAIFCAALFLVSAVMAGTYAWQNEQEALNNLFGSKTKLIPVELIKLEKQEDENAAEIFIPNTVFYLFRENGDQIGGKYVTDENGRIELELSAGKYYFEETSPGIGYTYDTDSEGNSITRYYFTVTENDEKITVKAYNIRLKGDLLIRKTVVNTDGSPLSDIQKMTAFTFTVTFSDGGSYDYRIDNGEKQTIKSGETLKLCSGQTAVFEGLPAGLLYEVTETPTEGYVTGGVGHRGNITEEQSVADFINSCEKSDLGTITVTKEVRGENADPDREFTFTAVFGDASVDFTLKDGESKTFEGIPLGTEFTVTEQDASKDGYTALKDTYSGQIITNETVILPFVNIYNETPPTDKTGDLTVLKKVIGENADKDKEFGFEVIFTGAGAPEDRIFTLKDGEKLTVKDIPHGVEYTVFETDAAGYWQIQDSVNGKIVGGEEAIVEFINCVPTKQAGSITVTKEVKGENADPEKAFVFTVEIEGNKLNFVLKHGESKTISGLPIGTKYTVTEAVSSNEGYIATVKEYTGKIVGTENILLPFVNIYEPEPDGTPGSLTVNKKVIGSNPDPEKEFTFKVVFQGENAPKEETFTLKADESKTFENLPHGVTYTVTETDAAGYDAAIDTANGTIICGQNSVVTFINRVPDIPQDTVKLTVQKLLAGEIIESDKQRQFKITLTVDGKTESFFLKADEIKEFEVPVGAVYEISEENYIADGFSQSILNGSGTVTDQPIAVEVINTYVGDPRVEIGGSKKWDMNGHTDVKLPEAITVQLKNGSLLVEEKTVKPDENNDWKYTFIAPEYNADGSLAVYNIEELPITSYRASYVGYDILNTYIKPIEVDPPIITKAVEGADAPNAAFEFVFTGKHGTPMPEGSEGYRKLIKFNGAGEFEIGTITFTEPGEYVYTVHEKNGGAKGWKYDTALYTVTITVTEENGRLSAERTIVKNGSDTDKVIFTNSFQSEIGDNIIVSGIKTWNHGNNPAHNRPTSITVKVYGDGETVAQRQVTKEDNWQYSFELPRYGNDGHEIVYTIDEADVENYSKHIDGYDLVNTYNGSADISDSPETGDNFRMMLWFGLMLFSLTGLIVTTVISKKRRVYIGKHLRLPKHSK